MLERSGERIPVDVGPGDQGESDLLQPCRVEVTERTRIGNARERNREEVELDGVNLHAARVDELRLSAAQCERAIGLDGAVVPGIKPAVAKTGGRRIRVVKVPRGHERPFTAHPTTHAGGHRLVRLINNLECGTRGWQACVEGVIRIRIASRHRSHLG